MGVFSGNEPSPGFFSSSKPANPIQEKPLVEQDELENDFVVLN